MTLADDWDLLANQTYVFCPRPVSGETSAYLIYTSGSTGKAKGVDISYQSLRNLCRWYLSAAEITSDCTLLQLIPFCFDSNIKNIFCPLMAGARLVMADNGPFDAKAVNRLIEEWKVDVVNCVPSVIYSLIEAAEPARYRSLHSLKIVALGGEATHMKRLLPWLLSPNCQCDLINMYGPTECTDISAAYRLNKQVFLSRWHAGSITDAELAAGLPIG